MNPLRTPTAVRLLPAIAATAICMGIPAAAQASASRGVVVTAGHGAVAVTNGAGTVSSYRLSGAERSLHFGTLVSYQASGKALTRVRSLGMAKTFTFDAPVASLKGRTLELTVGHGHLAVKPSQSVKAAAGDVVAVKERHSGRSWSATVAVKKAVTSSGPALGPITGTVATVTAIGTSSIQFLLPSGTTLTTTIPADAVTYFTENHVMEPCETTSIVYQESATGAVLASLIPTGITTSPAVALGGGGNCETNSDGEVDAVGTIIQLTPSNVTFALLNGSQVTWALAPGRDLQADEAIGDLADVTYEPSTETAYNLESSELYTTGVVTKISYWSMTVKDAVTGQSVVFPPDAAAYLNINKGDRVGVVYWIDGGKPEADNVSDLTTGFAN